MEPFAAKLQMGHPAVMEAIGAATKKSNQLDAQKIADMVRCNLLPECYVAPPELRELRRLLRYRNLVVDQAVQMKNRMTWMSCNRRGESVLSQQNYRCLARPQTSGATR